MITVILKESQIDRASAIMDRYNCKLSFSRVYIENNCYYAVSEGPLGALLTIRAELGDEKLQHKFGLL